MQKNINASTKQKIYCKTNLLSLTSLVVYIFFLHTLLQFTTRNQQTHRENKINITTVEMEQRTT